MDLLQQEGRLLLLGNEAVVRGALEAGISAFSTYPGTPASEIGDAFATVSERAGVIFEYAVNEKVAVESVVAFSLSGHRAMAAMKHVGLNVASDAFVTFAYLGTVGGAVIVTADDPGCHSSQNEQDNRYYARLAQTPMVEPAFPEEARVLTKAAFSISERIGLPILMRLTTRIAHMRGPVNLGPLPPRPVASRAFLRDPLNRVVVPAVARRRRVELLRRLEEARRIAEDPLFHTLSSKGDEDLGLIASGCSRNLAHDAIRRLEVSDAIAFLELAFTWPLPENLIANFLARRKKVLVLEELSPFLEEAVRVIAHKAGLHVEVLGQSTGHLPPFGELDPDIVERAICDFLGRPRPQRGAASTEATLPLPNRGPTLCPGCPHRASYLLAKQVVGPEALVATDIGCYTLGLNPPHSMADLLVCMGSSVSTGAALSVAQDRPVLAVIGDSTFFHAGIPALVHAVTQGRRLMVLVLDNRTTAMTGFQPHPGAALEGGTITEKVSIEAIARACGCTVVETLDPFKPKEAVLALERAWRASGVSVVVMRSPCPQMADRARILPRRPPVRIIHDRCRTCGNLQAGRHCGLETIKDYEEVRAFSRLRRPPKSLPLETPPCTKACPAQICVQGYVGLVAAGRFTEAYELVRRRIPFPAVCAFICPRPCEKACPLPSPIAIRHLKRMAVRFGFRPSIVAAGPDSGKKVAIVGAGPSGLTAAEYLRRFGHKVTVFDASERPGGLLTEAIPTFRLPKDLVEREISEILAMGVEFRGGVRFGRDIAVEELLRDFDALILAVGLQERVSLEVPGANHPCVLDALEFLRKAQLGIVRPPSEVVVIGGGNTAIDAARTALRLGASQATIVYRRSPSEMPAFPEEVEAARREGVRFVFQASPVAIEDAGNGACFAVFCKTRLEEPDEGGRRRPVPIPGSEFRLQAQLVLLALGQRVAGEVSKALGLGEKGLKVEPATMMTQVSGVFACGDVTLGEATVIEAIHQGQATASSVDHFLRFKEPKVSQAFIAPKGPDNQAFEGLAPSDLADADLPITLDPLLWEGRLELEGQSAQWLMEEAKREARRCLQCGTCANCRACVDLTGCPALRFDDETGRVEVIEPLCNGCGLCVALCPNGAIVSHDEVL